MVTRVTHHGHEHQSLCFLSVYNMKKTNVNIKINTLWKTLNQIFSTQLSINKNWSYQNSKLYMKKWQVFQLCHQLWCWSFHGTRDFVWWHRSYSGKLPLTCASMVLLSHAIVWVKIQHFCLNLCITVINKTQLP